MSEQTLPRTRPEPAGPPRSAGTADAVATAAEKFPRRQADPQDDWPLDVHLPDEREDGEC